MSPDLLSQSLLERRCSIKGHWFSLASGHNALAALQGHTRRSSRVHSNGLQLLFQTTGHDVDHTIH